MFLKKLKPIHGWRMFFGEVAIIVLGVGIALMAQQMVEDWTWRQDVAQARRQLVAETQDNFTYAAERLVVQLCIDAQADRLVARASAPGDRLIPAPPIESSMGPVALRQPSRPYRDDAWTAVVGDGVSAHLPNDERDMLASNYTQVRTLMAGSSTGDSTVDHLNLFLQPIALDPQLRASLIQEAMAAKSNTHRMSLVAGQVMSKFWELGLAPTADKVDRYLSYSGTIKYCREHRLPLGDWRQLLTAQRAEDMTRDNAVAFYRARHRR